MSDSAIEWTDATWNPTTGCDRVSPGCDNCYALTMAKRLKAMGQAKYQTDGDPRTSGPGFGLAMHDDVLEQPLRWRKPRRVFVNSMSDLFHPKVTDDFIARVFATMTLAQEHTFQVLTKRPKRARALLSSQTWQEQMHEHYCALLERDGLPQYIYYWPLRNVWLGTSVEDQQRADERIPPLLDTPATVRFLSCEPLLGPVDLSPWTDCEHDSATGDGPWPPNVWTCDGCAARWRDVADPFGECWSSARGNFRKVYEDTTGLHWVIVGGESGPGARPMHPRWARDLRDQAAAAGVPFFFKQWGAWAPVDGPPAVGDRIVAAGETDAEGMFADEEFMRHVGGHGGRELDGRTWDEFPQEAADG